MAGNAENSGIVARLIDVFVNSLPLDDYGFKIDCI